MSKLNDFNKRHEEAMYDIHRVLNDTDPRRDELRALVKFMLETDLNPYTYLPIECGGCFDSSVMFNSFIRCVSNALYDDGDICFPIVNDDVFIRFLDKNDPESIEKIKMDSWSSGKTDEKLEIKFCDGVYDFIEKSNERRLKRLEYSVKLELAFMSPRMGVKQAQDHVLQNYSDKEGFDINWLFQDPIRI